jgi:hypothetical protein
MNPKLKAVLISILFFPLVLIGNIIGTFANMVFQMFYTSIDFDFSYGEPIIIGVFSGAAAAYGVGMIAKSNEYFYHLIALPFVIFITASIILIIYGGSLDSLPANIITIISYIYFVKTTKAK